MTDYSNRPQYSDNPLRAAMDSLLMMKDSGVDYQMV